MGLFKKTRNRSQSTGSPFPQPLIQDSDDDVILPIDEHVYLTKTQDGKPALGRKKTSRLLQDFGCDILGQSFGVPSRRDYEERTRLQSIASQSSGLVTAQESPRRSEEASSDDDDDDDDVESIVPRRETSSRNPSSTSLPFAMTRYNKQGASLPHQQVPYTAGPTFPAPPAFGQHYYPPPPPPPPPFVTGWPNNTATNTSVPPAPMSYYGANYPPTHLPSYPNNGTSAWQGGPFWRNQQNHMATQYPNHFAMPGPQAAGIPPLSHYQQFTRAQPAHISHMQPMPFIPPPPPPPPPGLFHAHATSTKREASRDDKKQARNDNQVVEETHHSRNSSRGTKQTHEELDDMKDTEDVKKRLSKRIRHVHLCAGCGEKRSTRYQRAHPLKRGQIPPVNYCYRCLKDAADTDGDTSDDDLGTVNAYRKKCEQADVSWPKSDEDDIIDESEHSYQHSYRESRKKHNRFGPLSRLFSRRSSARQPPLAPRSVSSAEVSRSRASSPVSDRYAARSFYEAPKFPAINRNERGRSRTIRGSKAAVLPGWESTDADSSSPKKSSPLIPNEEKHGQAKKEGKIQTTSNNLPALNRHRSRIPRPRTQLRSSNMDVLTSEDTDGGNLTRILDETFGLDDPGMAKLGLASQPAGIEALPSSSNRITPKETARPAKLTSINVPTEEVVKKYGLLASQGTSRKAQGPREQHRSDRSSSTPVTTALGIVLPETTTTETLTDDPFAIFSSADPQISLSYGPRVDADHSDNFCHDPRRGSPKARSQRPSVDLIDLPVEPEATFNWEPLTPTDLPYTGVSHSPHVMSDSWSEACQTDMEREVEEMAERDLAFASKLFDSSLSSSLAGGGSATTSSAFPVSSYIASNMSIVSYNSDDSDNDHDHVATPSAIDSEPDEDVTAADKQKHTKHIEFSSEEEQIAKSKLPTELTVARVRNRNNHRMTERKNTNKNNMYNIPDGAQDEERNNEEDDVVKYDSSPIGSSLLGHTGHSMDDLDVRNTPPPPALPDRPVTDGSRLRRGLYQLDHTAFPTLF
ncbi:hypothetical protein F5B22DRAFT_267748 [Xylaria bambusicola]|uniref:uncharacterized protein n=1 Tax=Xylaria bambusicola TaxID=326684 RepID=UPI002007E3AA|nr:uncharacterized protein F5B22DRAFT_267748 [Xylaria bambusicola]KAI0526075.1 hypothetical protein F5B22DRAFT_267748 [Xylaria bambusicola]